MSYPKLTELDGEYRCKVDGCTRKLKLLKDGRRILLRGYCASHYEQIEVDPRYKVYRSMKQRCYNPNSPNYRYYGGRGITICDQWLDPKNGFENFCKDMGTRPEGTSIDRIDHDGGYHPSNCRWATIHVQQSNKRNNVDFVGVTYEASNDRYRSQLNVAGRVYRKSFKTLAEAVEHRKTLENEYLYSDGEYLAEKGLLTAIENTPTHAYSELYEAIEVTARRLEYFDSSDVWAILPTWTGSPSAIGGAFRQAVKDGVIEWTGMFQK